MANRTTNTTIYVGGLPPSIDETSLLSTMQVFGEVVDVQLPREKRAGEGQQAAGGGPHRGFGFVVFSTGQEAQDTIDNMHHNELAGRILNVNLAKPLKTTAAVGGTGGNRAIWDDEEWIKQHAQPLEGGGEAAAAVVEREA
ncbi:RNA-binding domain-containing protein [Jaminaea rosea]|uniref:RNA-binding domain-containing protein n=1 Tax=Jaminaea rosea TaxID=1569628 RepID=A0A316UQH5_9BASI|nr:RNA-binding domain-containing protein [Jaminaea rosea]PWN27540.1 RNA-binding domain-containing protein [Jaminaea rosea]